MKHLPLGVTVQPEHSVSHEDTWHVAGIPLLQQPPFTTCLLCNRSCSKCSHVISMTSVNFSQALRGRKLKLRETKSLSVTTYQTRSHSKYAANSYPELWCTDPGLFIFYCLSSSITVLLPRILLSFLFFHNTFGQLGVR